MMSGPVKLKTFFIRRYLDTNKYRFNSKAKHEHLCARLETPMTLLNATVTDVLATIVVVIPTTAAIEQVKLKSVDIKVQSDCNTKSKPAEYGGKLGKTRGTILPESNQYFMTNALTSYVVGTGIEPAIRGFLEDHDVPDIDSLLPF
ncbi:hypothetical protein DPMN_093922 [Dreissena polymorpha]|uniref:Uncharacterized protein n=1 Tax=Dreissena polymorpha TaxID=45954 RepID=A0A9D4L4T0_DREPO|nr:hypothetical protein DPMN_093922 [Dreissena polymorpha]